MNAQDEHQLYRRYSMIIEWSDEDDAYIVTVPELSGCMTHGATYGDAVCQGMDAIECWVDANIAWGRPIPPPRLFKMDDEGEYVEGEQEESSDLQPQKVS